jgi:hypothetical protein
VISIILFLGDKTMATQTQQDTVNGIDLLAFNQAIAEIEANPAAGETKWKVTSRWAGGTRTDHHVDGVDIGGQKVERKFQIQVDEP